MTSRERKRLSRERLKERGGKILTVSIERELLIKLERWMKKNRLGITEAVEKLIDRL